MQQHILLNEGSPDILKAQMFLPHLLGHPIKQLFSIRYIDLCIHLELVDPLILQPNSLQQLQDHLIKLNFSMCCIGPDIQLARINQLIQQSIFELPLIDFQTKQQFSWFEIKLGTAGVRKLQNSLKFFMLFQLLHYQIKLCL